MYRLFGMTDKSTFGGPIFGAEADGVSLTFGRLGCEANEGVVDIKG